MIKKIIVRAGLVFALLAAVLGCAAGGKDRETVTLSGTIRVVGNDPVTQVILVAEDQNNSADRSRETLITGPLTQELRKNFQGKSVTLEGKMCASSSPQFGKCFKPRKISID